MSAVSFSFRPEAIPAYAQTEFLSRFFQLVLDYQMLTEPVPEAPAASSLAQPSFDSEAPAEALPSAFHPVDGDEPAAVKPKKERKNPWAGLSEEQRTERLAAMKRGRELKKAERRLSADSLEASAAPVVVAAADDAASDTSSKDKKAESLSASDAEAVMRDRLSLSSLTKEQMAERVAMMRKASRAAKKAAAPAPVVAEADGAASETSSKKLRKNPWADLTPEQKAERVTKMQDARKAKKAVGIEGSA
jgi:hypothetical protein